MPCWISSGPGFDQRVTLDSTRAVTKTRALFIAEWCGLEPVAG